MKDDRRSVEPCFVERSLSKIGDSWTLLILRDASRGLMRFDEFRRSLRIAPNILTRKLTGLVEGGLLERVLYQSNPPRYQYVLTECGRDFLPVLHVMGSWGRRYLKEPDDVVPEPTMEVVVIDEKTGRPIDPSTPVWP